MGRIMFLWVAMQGRRRDQANPSRWHRIRTRLKDPEALGRFMYQDEYSSSREQSAVQFNNPQIKRDWKN